MENIEKIKNKIIQEYKLQIESILHEFEQKKVELEKKYNELFLDKQNKIKSDLEQKLQLEKKRIYTEKFVEFTKKVEQIKQNIISEIFSDAVEQIVSIPKQQYYEFIKKLLISYIFPEEENKVLFDNSGKLTLKEKQQLIKEVEQEVKKKFAKETKIIESDTKEPPPSFGLKIFCGKKVRDCSLETIIETLRSEIEPEVAKMLFSLE